MKTKKIKPGISYIDLKHEIIIPTLTYLSPEIPISWNAVDLLMGTAAVESKLGHHLIQFKGPALGIYQMEPSTYYDIINNFLQYQSDRLRDKIGGLRADVSEFGVFEIVGNLPLATAMARLHYWRVPEPLPTSVAGMARYWKKYYNTPLGKGTQKKFIRAYKEYYR